MHTRPFSFLLILIIINSSRLLVASSSYHSLVPCSRNSLLFSLHYLYCSFGSSNLCTIFKFEQERERERKREREKRKIVITDDFIQTHKLAVKLTWID